jgi:hypothetical protein
MRRALIGTVALALLCPAPAQAMTINGPSWAQRAVNEMRAPVVPDQTVILAPCPGYESEAACNFVTADSPIYINVSPLDTFASLRVVLYRELGGRFETVAMYPWAIEHFRRILRHHHAGREVFEDAYADCASGLMPRSATLHYSDDGWIDTSGYDPSPRQHIRVCRLISRVGVNIRLQTPSAAPLDPLRSIRPGSASRR